MNKELLNYLQNQIFKAKSRLLTYTRSDSGKDYPKRHIFMSLMERINDFLQGDKENRWVIMPGLRGVGKTTVLAQLYRELLLKKTNEEIDILYISLDEVFDLFDVKLKNVIIEYEHLLGTSYEKLDKPVILFIDEIQADSGWALTLKTLYDRSKMVFVICSGSSALHLQSTADTARRAIIEKLYPMTFDEYEMIKNGAALAPKLKSEIKKALYFADSSEKVFNSLKKLELKINHYWSQVDRLDLEEYLSIGTLPFALKKKNKLNIYDEISILIDKIITKDIRELGKFDTDTLGVIKRLLYILSDSDVISVNKLTPILKINHLTVANILEVLEKAELLIRVPAYGSNIGKVKKPAKYLFSSPALRISLLNISGIIGTHLTRQGKLLEDVVASYYYKEFVASGVGLLSYDSSEGSADFILQIANRTQIAIEVGLGKKDCRQVISTLERINCKYGIVFSNDPLTLNKKLNIVKVPIDYFLLS